ncbi:diguanylate cyclase/phosphodiesterase (GGDEF & EAL domains) with PAS/PAC sensor(s) [hydrothermal vent metagenome]|uniref:Diguanylate cyclase/phosphodiesterase (GGDEF & EAL domains) with PAS/PAC sensor(S) n=1 Tax=hydrothermal vent metagenome TaxID=652676 RepID=A0A3B1C7I3_9ZZZZ
MKLTHRVFLFILMIISLSSLANFLLTQYQEEALHNNSEKMLAQTLVQSLRDALVQDVIEGNKSRVTTLLRNLKEHDNPIEFLYVTSNGRGVFAHSFEKGFPGYIRHQKDSSRELPGIHLAHKYQTKNGLIYEYTEVLIPGRDTILHIGFNQSEIAEKLAQNSEYILMMSGLITLFAFLIGYIWSQQITAPLAEFAHQIQRFGAGQPVNFSNLKKDTQEIHQLATVFQVVSDERRQAFAHLQEREQNLTTTLNSIGDAVIATDRAGNITRMNPVAEALIGCRASEAMGRPLLEVFRIINAQTREAVASPVEKVLRTGRKIGLANHTLLISLDGSEYQIADSAAPIKDKKGEVLGVILVFRDVSQQYQIEESLRRSQKMEAIGQLSGGIAHDFNNLLGVIIGYLDFLKNCFADGDEAQQWVKTASNATLRCVDLTRQLLAFSRRQSAGKKVVNINKVLKEQEIMISRSVTPEVEVEYDLSEDLCLTEIDPGEFQDAILNLAINARDAMPDGGKLFIETSNTSLDADYVVLNPEVETGDYVQLMLSDTGTGMDGKTLERIFEPFFTTKPEGKGTGLGMAMVYGFVKRYGGHIKIYSEPGVGTSIRLYLPCSSANESALVINNTDESDFPRGCETILIVDDEIDLLHLAEYYLNDLGYQTHLAENGQQALEILAKEKGIDLLFSDVVMPGGINGYELAQQVTEFWPHIKVLLSSGFTSKTVAHNGLARFAVYLLNKPYRKADLAQRIRRVLDEGTDKVVNLSDTNSSKDILVGRSILVVDDEEDIRDLFKLNLERLGCKVMLACNGEEAVALYRQSLDGGEAIDAVILDLSLPGGMGGAVIAESIHGLNPQAKIIVASGHTEAAEMAHYQEHGFSAALEKNFERKNIRQVLEQVLSESG